MELVIKMRLEATLKIIYIMKNVMCHKFCIL